MLEAWGGDPGSSRRSSAVRSRPWVVDALVSGISLLDKTLERDLVVGTFYAIHSRCADQNALPTFVSRFNNFALIGQQERQK